MFYYLDSSFSTTDFICSIYSSFSLRADLSYLAFLESFFDSDSLSIFAYKSSLSALA